MDPQTINPELKELLEKVQSLKRKLSESESFKYAIVNFSRGDIIIHEEEDNDSIYIILDGLVQLSKVYDYETEIQVDRLEPGDLLGLLSFWTGQAAFVTATARTPVTTLCLSRMDFNRISETNPELNKILQPLIINNFAKRYRRIVSLHLRVATLTRELELERNHLKTAFEKLEQTSKRLIHQEKMATLGQLVAGLAHELNNPTSALVRSVDGIIENVPGLLMENNFDLSLKIKESLLKLGLNKALIGTEEQRLRMDGLSLKFPTLSRSLIRTLAQIDSSGLELIESEISKLKNDKRDTGIESLLKIFEIGSLLKSVKVSAERINKLVKSLKSYSRQQKGELEPVDLRQGIEDTLLILGNRLKNYAFHINLPEIPKINCNASEINQVWTNIILNACDAMGDKGFLKIECGIEDQKYVWVSIADNGPGIPADIIDKIFEPNFTTKTASGSFGLGLGLSISNEIILKHGGKIIVHNTKEGGAFFKILLLI